MSVADAYQRNRLIPVLTGNRPDRAISFGAMAVNPRAYGEQRASVDTDNVCGG